MTYHKKLLSIAFTMLMPVAFVPSASAAPRTYGIVSAESSATFQTAMMMERIIGGTSDITGTIVVDADAPGTGAEARIAISTPSLKSDNHRRDEHMHRKALQSDTYPTITVTSTQVSTDAGSLADGEAVTFDVAATLTLHGQTRPMTFPVTVTRQGDTLTLDGDTNLLMTDFGITPPRLLLLKVRNLTEIHFHLVARPEST